MELGRSVFLGYSPAPRPVVLALDAAELRAGPTVLAARRARGPPSRGPGPSRRSERGREDDPAQTSARGEPCPNPSRSSSSARRSRPETPGQSSIASARSRSEARGRTLSLVAALGTDPDRLLASAAPSPGEVRKLLLAEGLARQPWAVVLDEPTNHLDLPTVERLAAALSAYPGAAAAGRRTTTPSRRPAPRSAIWHRRRAALGASRARTSGAAHTRCRASSLPPRLAAPPPP